MTNAETHVRVLMVRYELFISHNMILYLRAYGQRFEKESRRARCPLAHKWRTSSGMMLWNPPDLAGTFLIECPQPFIINRLSLRMMFSSIGLVLGGVRRGGKRFIVLLGCLLLSIFYLRHYIFGDNWMCKLLFLRILGSF